MNRDFHKELFSLMIINKTITAFAHLADISFNETDSHWKVHFENCKFDIEKTASEFENYLIQLEFMESKRVV